MCASNGTDDEENLSKNQLEAERETLLRRIGDALDLPMTILSLIWVGLLIIELALPLRPEISDRVIKVDFAIWLIFVADFAFEFMLAPNKLRYLRSNALVALSLALPFVRVIRIFRLARAFRSVSLVRITLVANRGATAIAEIFSRHRIHYVVALSALATLLGAGGIYFFERDIAGTPFRTFGDALWWSAAMVTTINTGAEPVSFEGRVIGLLLRAFAMAIFGYVAASIASYLVGQRIGGAQERRADREAIERLTREVSQLSASISELKNELERDSPRNDER